MSVGNKYKYGFVDLSYLLVRSTFAVARGKKVNEFTPGEIVRLFLMTLNKISREQFSCDRFVLLADKWSKEYGGYYGSYMIKDYVAYKGSRKYMTDWEFERLKSDPTTTSEVLKKAELELYTNKVKTAAKKIIEEYFPNLGITTISVPGLECDNLAYMCAGLLYDPNDKPSVIITKDSDILYELSPKLDYFKLSVAGSKPEVITYDQMYETIPKQLVSRGITLYEYHAYLDALGAGHNDLAKTAKPRIDYTEAILKILDGDYSDVENPELFRLQLDTFDLNKYPSDMIDNAKDQILNINKKGRIGSVPEFRNFCTSNGILGISDSYYDGFVGRFDQKLFSEDDRNSNSNW